MLRSGTDSQWPSYAWCSLPHSLNHPPLYYLQPPQEITLCHMPDRVTHFWILYWTWNSKLWFGLSRLVYGGLCRHCTVFSLNVCLSFVSQLSQQQSSILLCVCTDCGVFLDSFLGITLMLNKKMFNAFMLHAWTCVSLSACLYVCLFSRRTEIMWLLLFLMSFVVNFLFVIHLILGS